MRGLKRDTRRSGFRFHLTRSAAVVWPGFLGLIFVLGYVARHVNPQHFWFAQIIAVGLPLVSLLVIISLIRYAFKKRLVWFGIYLGLSVLVAFRFVSVPSRGSSSDNAGTLTVLCLNSGGFVSNTQNRGTFKSLIGDLSPDVVALQESFIQNDSTGKGLLSRSPATELVQLNYRYKLPVPGEYSTVSNPIFSRSEIVEFSRNTLSDNEPPFDASEYMTRAELVHGGLRFAVYNVHLESFGARVYIEASSVHRRQIAGLTDVLENETLPYIVCGDFNGTRHNWTVHQISKVAREIRPAWSSGWSATYPARIPLLRIDHVFVSAEFTEVSLKRSGRHCPITCHN